MKTFLDDDFLLDSECAKELYHKFAENMPICDYHCHLSPKEIYENKPVKNITELWLSGDHYKWRIMRACGVNEDLITGSGDDREKFRAFAASLQYAIGNPLYHWAHLELRRYFGIFDVLSEKTADMIYDKANSVISDGDFRPQTLITKSNVNYICTTDDPIDDLNYHIKLKDVNGFETKVLPTFRPDKALNIELSDFGDYISLLEKTIGTHIENVDDVVTALYKRADYFNSVGCKVSDQSFGYIPFALCEKEKANEIFTKRLSGAKISENEADAYKTYVFTELSKKYKSLNWACEIHIGALRNNNSLMFSKLGADTGFDTMNDKETAENLNALLNNLNNQNALGKTILFNLNPKDNIILISAAGNFQCDDENCKIQFGPAWWFLDTLDGMTNQLKALAASGVLGKFVGMETDSRSFTSYARHEYFRRILCRVLGQWIENGEVYYDEDVIKEIVEGICYNNAIKYLSLE